MITASSAQIFPSWHEHHTGEVPTVADIAQGLGRMVRFAGQTVKYYSVLTHSIVCSELVDDEYKIYALLHDAPEAIVSDVPTTWKSDEAVENEMELLCSICQSIGVPLYWVGDALIAVKQADAACLAAEAHALGHAQAERWWPKDQWGDLEIKAFDLTIEMLQKNLPMLYLNPVYSVPAYQKRIDAALQVPA